VNVKAGSTVVFTLTADVDPDADKEIENTATVTPAKGVKDKSDDDNSSSDKSKVVHRGDVSITKTDGREYAVQGRRVTYTIVASNSGPSGAKGVKITDKTERVLEGVTWTCTPTSGKATCSDAGGDGDPIDVKVDLPPKSSVTFLVSAILNSKAQGDLRNTVTATVDSDQFEDTNLANNKATDKDKIWKEWLKNPPKDSAPKPVKQQPVETDVASKIEQKLDDVVPPVLALTGSEVAGVLFIGTLMIGFGSILAVGGRRRKRQQN
jgi:uncharacterized repeat protein (TIGR01451 family)